MRILFASLIWFVDMVLKFALGYLVVFGIVWVAGGKFDKGSQILAPIIGAMINGFFEGSDIFLLGWAKQIAEGSKASPKSPRGEG